jgi:hypothetical protein
MTDTLPRRFAQVRIAVAFLGEAALADWWSSSFLSPAGLAIAEYNFPRAPSYAALNATTAAAKRLHDDRIGRRRSVHLFRLSLVDEMMVQQAIQADGCRMLNTMPKNRAEAMKVLESEGGESISVVPGPVQVGTVADAFTEKGLAELAKHYHAAFQQDVKCLPFFSNVRR